MQVALLKMRLMLEQRHAGQLSRQLEVPTVGVRRVHNQNTPALLAAGWGITWSLAHATVTYDIGGISRSCSHA